MVSATFVMRTPPGFEQLVEHSPWRRAVAWQCGYDAGLTGVPPTARLSGAGGVSRWAWTSTRWVPHAVQRT
jgi:hypothetical protein